MDGDSEDEYDTRDLSPSTDTESRDQASETEETFGIDDITPRSLIPGTNLNTNHANRALQPFAAECSSYDIVPYVAAVHGCHVYAIDATKNMRWIFTGGDDGFVRKYDFFSSLNGKQILTQNQRHAHVESVQKAGVILSYWENEEQPLPTAPPTPVTNGVSENQSQGQNGTNHDRVNQSETSQPSPLPQSSAPPSVLLNTEPKLSPVYSLASGSINLYTVRHEEGRCHHVLRQHRRPVSVLKITQDEYGCVSGSWDKTVLYWDLNTGQVVREFAGHNSQISSISFRPLVTPSPRSLSNENSLIVPELPNDQEDTIIHSNNILMTTSIDGNCFLWDKRAREPIPRKLHPPERTPPWTLSACWSADGSKIYCGRRNGTVDEWDFASGKCMRIFRMPSNSGPVSCVSGMPNGKHIVCSSTDNIRLWNVSTDEAELFGTAVPFLIVPGHHGGIISQICILNMY
ncbi:1636_t:CDS:10 [Paraglomus occultum]|uniref:1636_t:CDS:1 n=1 Tax=Paraglomus occultum TaxID=144539 RepID=A0A9N9BU11_9GLOM|nr:1636_t:CDS:10 [Paraglomus occultum]